MENQNKQSNNQSRREFLSNAALLTLGAGTILSACGEKKDQLVPLKPADQLYIPTLTDKAVDGAPLKAGLVGCGGRGRGAVYNFLDAADNVTIVALGDVFEDRVKGFQKELKDNKQIDIPDANCFVGFDAYKKVMDTDIDVVLVATPPVFRPEHFKYAVEKGKHAFLEKPIAVDAVGYRTLIAAAKQAATKGLCCVTGTQRHHQRCYVESYKQVQAGLIGEITGGNVYWNQNMLWYRTRENGWSDMEWMIKDWVNWKWLSGDHIVEQHVHNIDVFNWFYGKKPIKATAFGARHRRITGDQYDMFSVDFEYEGGIHMHSMCRQIDGCNNNVSEFIQGTKGSWNSADMKIRDLQGNVIWEYDWEKEKTDWKQNDPYTLEHVNLITCIRNKKPICQVEETAISSLCAVMGREAAYTGQEVTWDQISSSELNYMPAKLEMSNVDMSAYTVPVPGSGK